MKKLIILLLLFGCSKPDFKPGDCVEPVKGDGFLIIRTVQENSYLASDLMREIDKNVPAKRIVVLSKDEPVYKTDCFYPHNKETRRKWKKAVALEYQQFKSSYSKDANVPKNINVIIKEWKYE